MFHRSRRAIDVLQDALAGSEAWDRGEKKGEALRHEWAASARRISAAIAPYGIGDVSQRLSRLADRLESW